MFQQTSFQKPEEVTFQRPESFKQPESFDRPEMNFNRPNPVPQRNPEYREDNNGNEVEDPFTFRAEMQDPFQEMSSEYVFKIMRFHGFSFMEKPTHFFIPELFVVHS